MTGGACGVAAVVVCGAGAAGLAGVAGDVFAGRDPLEGVVADAVIGGGTAGVVVAAGPVLRAAAHAVDTVPGSALDDAAKLAGNANPHPPSAPQPTPAFRGPSQPAPGGQAGPAVSLSQVKQCLGRCGLSVRNYDIAYTPQIDSPFGPAFGRTSVVDGKPVIEISDLGLSSMDEAVATIFHETYHVNSLRAFGHTGTEAAAESFGQRMLNQFQRRTR